MKAKFQILIVLAFPLFIMTNCLDMMEKWYAIKVNNDTDKDIFVSAGCPRYNIPNYPDTTLPNIEPSLLRVNPHDYNYLRSSIKWEIIIDEIPSDTLSIYLFNADTLNYYSWDQIIKGNKILKRLDLSLVDLQQTNWTITYQ